MKRHPDLAGLYDDHHQGLVNALRLERSAAGEGTEPLKAARDFLDFWREHTRIHFRKEEETLLPVVAAPALPLTRSILLYPKRPGRCHRQANDIHPYPGEVGRGGDRELFRYHFLRRWYFLLAGPPPHQQTQGIGGAT